MTTATTQTRSKRRRRTPSELQEILEDALHRAQQSTSIANHVRIIDGFSARGIPESEIRPGDNVFTYNAWRALGREILPGARGVVAPVIAQVDRDVKTTETETETRLYILTVKLEFFHESQTDAD